MNREFLGKRAFPYQQVFRVDLVRSETKDELFDFTKLYVSLLDSGTETSRYEGGLRVSFQVQTGTMAGVIYGDVLEVFHVLRPGFKVRATVSQSQPLNAIIEIKDEETLRKFKDTVKELYQVVMVVWKHNEGGTAHFSFSFLLPLPSPSPLLPSSPPPPLNSGKGW